MVCDVCKERDAAVHLTTIEDNAVHQLHLCEKCAAERGVETRIGAVPVLQHDHGGFSHDGPLGLRALLLELRGGDS